MQNLKELEGYSNGATYSRLNGVYYELPNSFVLCTIPRLFTPHCANELKAADDIYREFKDFGINLIFASTDSPEVAEQYFGQFPVSFPFIRINYKLNYEIGTIDRFGDAHRASYYIKDGKLEECIVTDFDSERDMWSVLQKAKEVLL